jgi:hypothetical protein
MGKTYVKVQFKDAYANKFGDKEYTFGTYKKLEVDDIVVVDTVNGVALGKISDVDVVPPDGVGAFRLVICKINLNEHLELARKEAKAEEIKKKLRARLVESVQMETYKRLSENDPVMKALLDDLSKLEQ